MLSKVVDVQVITLQRELHVDEWHCGNHQTFTNFRDGTFVALFAIYRIEKHHPIFTAFRVLEFVQRNVALEKEKGFERHALFDGGN